MKCVDLWVDVLKECLAVLDLVDDGSVVASVLWIVSGLLARVRLLHFSWLRIVYVGWYVKVCRNIRWLHGLIFLILFHILIGWIFNSLLYSTMGLILIDIFTILDLGQILIDFLTLNFILNLGTRIWFMKLLWGGLLLNRQNLSNFLHELAELYLALLQALHQLQTYLALE